VPLPPVGFWSYTRGDDDASRGRLSGLRALLLARLRQRMGRLEVQLFQDVAAIPPGTEWQKQIDSAVRESSFMIPIITPGMLHSPNCAYEIKAFRALMQQRGRNDLILPILFSDVALFDTVRRGEIHDPALYDYLKSLQWVDFTKLETKPLDSPEVGGWILAFASNIVKKLYTDVPPPLPRQSAVAKTPPAAGTRPRTPAPEKPPAGPARPPPPDRPPADGPATTSVPSGRRRTRTASLIAVFGIGLLALGAGVGVFAGPWIGRILDPYGVAGDSGGWHSPEQLSQTAPVQPPALITGRGKDLVAEAGQPPSGAAGGARPQAVQQTPMEAAKPAVAPAGPIPPVSAVAAKPLPRCDVCPEMVVIPSGMFWIGDSTWTDSQPLQAVTFKQPFHMAKYPVTVGEFRVFLAGNSAYVAHEKWKDAAWKPNSKEPAVYVSHDDALAYAGWLNRVIRAEITARRETEYRLPSETEWEYAARAGEQGAYFWGDRFEVGARFVPPRVKGAVPAETLQPNRFGLFGMLGLVRQWVADPWHPDYNGLPTDGSVWKGGGDVSRRVTRGGSWSNIPRVVSSGFRGFDAVRSRDGDTGFRLARSSFSP
jgi:formylglycine-generating enzyme required for sulfatase activity